MNGCIDVSTDDGRDKLVRFVANMNRGIRGMPYGPYTVLYIYPEIDGPCGRKHVKELWDPKCLSDTVRENIRREMPEYASEL